MFNILGMFLALLLRTEVVVARCRRRGNAFQLRILERPPVSVSGTGQRISLRIKKFGVAGVDNDGNTGLLGIKCQLFISYSHTSRFARLHQLHHNLGPSEHGRFIPIRPKLREYIFSTSTKKEAVELGGVAHLPETTYIKHRMNPLVSVG